MTTEPGRKRLVLMAFALTACAVQGASILFPTENRALLEPGGEERYFVGTVGKPWSSGTFGCVRSEGFQFHEGIDIRCVRRDSRGEPVDPVLAVADAAVAYVNRRAGLSNYGNYVVLRHLLDGIEVYSLYAHLSAIEAGLKPGMILRQGDRIGVMGRSTNTREGISRDRAHLHFELALFLSERFAWWHAENSPGQTNEHGIWNGQNLIGMDPAQVLLEQGRLGGKFNLRTFIRSQPVVGRVVVRAGTFPWVKRYAALVDRAPAAASSEDEIAAYELTLAHSGMPIRAVPIRAASVGAGPRFEVVAVDREVFQAHRCRRLFKEEGGGWGLTNTGMRWFELLVR